MNAAFRSLLAALFIVLLGADAAAIATSGQLLAYQDGFVFFTTGDGFRVAPDVSIENAQTHQPTKEQPRPRLFARAVFNAGGVVTEIDLSPVRLPPEPLEDEADKFAVALSTPAPNPDIDSAPTVKVGGIAQVFTGREVLVKITVEVPPNTPSGNEVYITTDAAQWNPQAIPMNRIDALHFQVTSYFRSGTILHYLYTRGSLQSQEVGQNGLTLSPRTLVITDADVRDVPNRVYGWADLTGNSQQGQGPTALPTPYNPSPFGNIPHGVPTPHP